MPDRVHRGKNGSKIFEVSDDAALLMKRTKLSGLKFSDLRLPYKCQYIFVPRGITTVHDGSVVRGACLSLAHGSFSFTCDTIKDTIILPIATFGYAIVPDEDIMEQLEHNVISKHADNAFIKDVVAFCINCLVFIANKNLDVRQESWSDIDGKVSKLHGNKKKDYISRLKQNNYLRIKIGESIKLNKDDREAFVTGRHRLNRTLVIGHWRHYWYGQRESELRERKLKWIEPFWVGSELFPTSNTPHLIQTEGNLNAT